ncbi:MAG TPA: ABC-type transport auxiliary lipoprotein family protein, partial [Terricaulis sp.]|nr:ABC-type transport auxiliary lipoprotein family protein [Terricaulis sp.]
MMRASLFLLPVLLGGCISLLPDPPPPPRVFSLDIGAVERASAARIDATIGIANPDGERVILGADMIWRTGQEIAYVAGTQWSGRADDLLQSALIETMSRQGRFAGVTRSGEARTQFDVRWEVRDFEIDGNAMQARFAADVRIMASPGRRLIAQETITASAPVSDRSASVAADALA